VSIRGSAFGGVVGSGPIWKGRLWSATRREPASIMRERAASPERTAQQTAKLISDSPEYCKLLGIRAPNCCGVWQAPVQVLECAGENGAMLFSIVADGDDVRNRGAEEIAHVFRHFGSHDSMLYHMNITRWLISFRGLVCFLRERCRLGHPPCHC